MHRLLSAGLCATLLCPSPLLLASTVFRCEDDNGHITFTLHGCPAEHTQQLQSAENPTPGSDAPVPLAKTAKGTRMGKTGKKAKDSELVIVGERQDGCGNRVTGNARRTAMIQKEVRAGMTRADVESALGKPDKISSQNGQLRYQYSDNEGRSRRVSFDEDGCVKGKR